MVIEYPWRIDKDEEGKGERARKGEVFDGGRA